MIRIQMIRSNTRHPDKRRRHQGRACCEVAGQRFETHGPSPIYRMATLLWLHGHGAVEFEVHDDVSPTGKPGGLAMCGKVRNWARLVNGKPTFDKDALSELDFSPHERGLIARAAGSAAEIDSPRPDNDRTAAISPPDGPILPPGERSRPYGAILAPYYGGGVVANKKPAPKKAKIGRPSLYTEALAAKLCRHIDRPICNRRRKPCPS